MPEAIILLFGLANILLKKCADPTIAILCLANFTFSTSKAEIVNVINIL